MAFKPFQSDIISTTPFEFLPQKAGEAYEVGELLKLADGAITKASGTDIPEYVCQQQATGEDGKLLAVYKIPQTMSFETTASAAIGSVALGSKVTISDDGMEVTATAGGAATVIYKAGADAGSLVHVRF